MKKYILPMALVLAGIGSIPPVAAQEPAAQQQQQPGIPSEFADLAEDYANRKAEAVLTAQQKTWRQKKKRWGQQLREAYNSLDSASGRFDRIDNLMAIVEADDPDIPKVKAEIAARTDRAYEQAKQWAEVEEVAVALPDAFANAVTERFGVKIDFGGNRAELLPPSPKEPVDDSGWLSQALNSSEAKGAGGASALALLLFLLKRQKDKEKKEADERNARVSEEAADRSWKKREATAAGQGSGGNTQ